MYKDVETRPIRKEKPDSSLERDGDDRRQGSPSWFDPAKRLRLRPAHASADYWYKYDRVYNTMHVYVAAHQCVPHEPTPADGRAVRCGDRADMA